ncbi:hypothetical protein [Umezawaea beigongshangensis]|uniref:hypothetical protein n=1 Tax=Umezawaea beigongshangensis TaxID=2780383 RepID=UPI0018F23301|nr:hypothetical protein [Umezawaea beigongshangensis]
MSYPSQYQGFGMYQAPQQKPPRGRRPLWLALGVIGLVVLVVGGVVAAVLISRGDAEAGGAPSPTPASTSNADPAEDWQEIRGDSSKIVYEVPPTWISQSGTVSASQVELGELMKTGTFECRGEKLVQAYAGSGTSTTADPKAVAVAVATSIAVDSYSVDGNRPSAGQPKISTITRDGVTGVRADVEVTPTAVSACHPPKGLVTVVALPHASGTAVVTLNVAQGGPHSADGPTDDEAERILDSVRLA